MANYTKYDAERVRLVGPEHDELVYCGRIDDTDREAPVFVQPGSFVRMSFSGSGWVRAVVVNRRRWHDSWVGALVDQTQYRRKIERDNVPEEVVLAEGLDRDLEHEVTFFKRMDQCHEFTFLGFLLERGARVEKARKLPRKKIEFYGDSVTAGEVTEAVDYMRSLDPPHNGEFNNAYFSFAWATARKLHARAHIVAQGGIALLDGTGYYEPCPQSGQTAMNLQEGVSGSARTEPGVQEGRQGKTEPEGQEGRQEQPETHLQQGRISQPETTWGRCGTVGMESCFDRVYFYPEDGQGGELSLAAPGGADGVSRMQPRMERWNFARYTPHVVVVAIGQNDAHPEDIMRQDYRGAKAEEWRAHYKAWIQELRRIYPRAWIVLTTTILYHHPGWDRSIGRVCAELNDPRIVHFLFEETGRGTPGHVRVSEAMNMALELAGFIEGLSDRVWED